MGRIASKVLPTERAMYSVQITGRNLRSSAISLLKDSGQL
jgi:hypothetical protein